MREIEVGNALVFMRKTEEILTILPLEIDSRKYIAQR